LAQNLLRALGATVSQTSPTSALVAQINRNLWVRIRL
jgi:hypothetical protein